MSPKPTQIALDPTNFVDGVTPVQKRVFRVVTILVCPNCEEELEYVSSAVDGIRPYYVCPNCRTRCTLRV